MKRSTVLTRAIVTFFAFIILILTFSPFLNHYSENYLSNSFKKSLATFAIARGVNGVISVIQGTELALQPAGVGVNVTAGEILDPINDLIESFSNLMLFTTAVIGVQKLLLSITTHPLINILLLVVLLYSLTRMWWPGLKEKYKLPTLANIIVFFLFIRFALPVMALSSSLISTLYLDNLQEEHTRSLQIAGEKIEEIHQENPVAIQTEDQTLLERMKNFVGKSIDSLNLGKKMEMVKEKISEISEDVINLMAIFCLQTILIPLLFLWLYSKSLKLIYLD